jgi:hypothetical protein
MRLRWEDPRLRYAAEITPRGFQEFRGPNAEQKLKEVWAPQVAFTNLKDSPSNQTTSLRIFPDGWVELMERTSGQFSIPINAGAFPFDKQALDVEITVRRETTGEASLVVLQEDIEFSRPAQDFHRWRTRPRQHQETPQRVGMEFHSGLVVGLSVARNPGRRRYGFIPLPSSLLIPLGNFAEQHQEVESSRPMPLNYCFPFSRWGLFAPRSSTSRSTPRIARGPRV